MTTNTTEKNDIIEIMIAGGHGPVALYVIDLDLAAPVNHIVLASLSVLIDHRIDEVVVHVDEDEVDRGPNHRHHLIEEVGQDQEREVVEDTGIPPKENLGSLQKEKQIPQEVEDLQKNQKNEENLARILNYLKKRKLQKQSLALRRTKITFQRPPC